MENDDSRGSEHLVRCPSCGTHRRRDDACGHCDEGDAAAPRRRSRGRSALIATALLGLSAFPAACGDSDGGTRRDIGAAPAYGIPPIEASVRTDAGPATDAGTAADATPDRGADLPGPAYGLPPPDAGTD